jgi:Smg protein
MADMLDVLLFLFEHAVDGQVDVLNDHSSLIVELQSVGFEREQIQNAFDWLLNFINNEKKSSEHNNIIPSKIKSSGMRVYNEEELERLPSESLYTLFALEKAGFVTADMREEVITRSLSLNITKIQPEHFNWLLLSVINKLGGSHSASVWLQDFQTQKNVSVH